MKRIFLYGPPASGKSTLAKALSRQLKATSCDLDEVIVQSAGKTIPEIFAQEGEAKFRQRESEALAKVVGDDIQIVALGGGTLLNPANRELCEQHGAVIGLEAPSEAELERRFAKEPNQRPLGNKAAERAEHYATFEKRVAAFFDLGNSLVLVGNKLAPTFLEGERVVSDGKVAELHPEIVPLKVIPSGEENKTPATVMSLWSAFAQAGLGRENRVAALGGGVTGDLTGFAAATWMRGMDWINLPTTLLSMVDASVGGKTGCDLAEGKNLAGAFHSPKVVVIDREFLKTLPREILADGRAEMIKHQIIGGLDNHEDLVANLQVKINIVREDPFETRGKRLLLNCGHTIGHAVEKQSNYTLSHGKAVAIGCVEEARLAVRMGMAKPEWVEELAEVFRQEELPTELPTGVSFESLKGLMLGDKKKTLEGTVTFALPCGWGDVRAVKVSLT